MAVSSFRSAAAVLLLVVLALCAPAFAKKKKQTTTTPSTDTSTTTSSTSTSTSTNNTSTPAPATVPQGQATSPQTQTTADTSSISATGNGNSEDNAVCGGMKCGPGERCCASMCYNPQSTFCCRDGNLCTHVTCRDIPVDGECCGMALPNYAYCDSGEMCEKPGATSDIMCVAEKSSTKSSTTSAASGVSASMAVLFVAVVSVLLSF
eukprot:gnl/Spiro4/29300_TR14332_c0_g1_i1.p2 gnl/Spiro4/29300_TR14332_c0_g1~~gnl/Spiro4/29300_TR14332_c0_g1_i1.p2  ORF type:complete len:207 (-),score=71.04 gnl/Spiro4/29300_TR14332_c0_g1_i1:52-672(-)